MFGSNFIFYYQWAMLLILAIVQIFRYLNVFLKFKKLLYSIFEILKFI
jgi:hypothetical protein